MRFEFNDDSQKICNSADVVNYGIQCDICGNKFQSVSNINGRRYCAECYHQIFGKDNQQIEITQLKQQLAEKQNTIDEINKEFVQAVHDWKTLCAEKDKEIKKLNWQLKDKDFIIKNLNHSLSVTPNANAGQRARIDELTKIVKEKDKEIERLKNLFELNNEVVINQGKEIFDLRVQVLQQKQNQTQLAIQELEKLKASADKGFDAWKNSKYEGNIYDKLDVSNAYLQMSCEINRQINELKGEKDE